MFMFLVATVFAWIVLLFTVKETRGMWQIFLLLILLNSVTSTFFPELYGYFSNYFFLGSLIIAVFCFPYLAYRGYNIGKWRTFS